MLTDDAPENVDREPAPAGGGASAIRGRASATAARSTATTVRRATEPPSAERPYTEEDGQATALADAAAIVFVADCLPVLLAADGAVAALHCGWRPLAGGIVDEGVRALARGRRRRARSPPRSARAPAAAATRSARRSTRTSRPTTRAAGATSTSRSSRARSSRRTAIEVLDTGLCTICDERFFSHRRDKGITGRQAGVVCRA